jgi:hypothetical protein
MYLNQTRDCVAKEYFPEGIPIKKTVMLIHSFLGKWEGERRARILSESLIFQREVRHVQVHVHVQGSSKAIYSSFSWILAL